MVHHATHLVVQAWSELIGIDHEKPDGEWNFKNAGSCETGLNAGRPAANSQASNLHRSFPTPCTCINKPLSPSSMLGMLVQVAGIKLYFPTELHVIAKQIANVT